MERRRLCAPAARVRARPAVARGGSLCRGTDGRGCGVTCPGRGFSGFRNQILLMRAQGVTDFFRLRPRLTTPSADTGAHTPHARGALRLWHEACAPLVVWPRPRGGSRGKRQRAWACYLHLHEGRATQALVTCRRRVCASDLEGFGHELRGVGLAAGLGGGGQSQGRRAWRR